jgi:DNA polymerase I-like protein with 3'-5' exonuclease and polymerase domains
MDFSYKLLNYLIQGSAADQTKEALIDWHENRDWETVFLATVHDEINISAPEGDWKGRMGLLRDCMNRERFDVPMLSEGFVGPNWQDIEACE